MTTDLTERGLERLICKALTGDPCDPPSGATVREPPPGYGGVGWSPGNHHDYDRGYCVDVVQLSAFLDTTQPDSAPALRLDEDCPTRRKFLARLQGEINRRGTIDVLRNGVRHGPHHLDLFYVTPSARNEAAQRRFEQNRFTVTRQLRYSRDETQRSLDIGLFINGLPGSIKSVSTPTRPNHRRTSFAVNSGPLSDRRLAGGPCSTKSSTSPGSVHRSASSTTRSSYDGLKRRRVGLSTTSASGAAAALRLPSQVSGAIPFFSILSRCLSILGFSAFALL